MKRFSACLLASHMMFAVPASADTVVPGKIQSLFSYRTHSGLLVRLVAPMPDPDSCGRTDWYIFPDASPRAALVQSMLLAAQSSSSDVWLTVDGCVEGMPAIVNLMKN